MILTRLRRDRSLRVSEPAPDGTGAGLLLPSPKPASAEFAAAEPVAPEPAAATARRRPRAAALAAIAALGALLAYAAYMLAVASDQYVTELRFAVRSAETNLRATGLPGAATPTAIDSFAVVDYLRSPDAARDLVTRLDLRAMFARPEIDPLSRLPADASAERIHRYLGSRLRAYFDHTSGIVTVELRAFSAADAFVLAEAVSALSEELINRMSLRARQGLLQSAEAELAAAERALTRSRDALREFRETHRIIDPRQVAEAEATLRARLESEIATLTAQLQATSRFANDNSPQVAALRTMIEALRQQVRTIEARAASADPGALTAALRGFETLETEAMMALRSYDTTLRTVERVRADASRQQLYLAHVVRATLPDEPMLPRRLLNVATAAVLAMAGFLLASLMLRAAREHVS